MFESAVFGSSLRSILNFFENTDFLFQKEVKEQEEMEKIQTREKIK